MAAFREAGTGIYPPPLPPPLVEELDTLEILTDYFNFTLSYLLKAPTSLPLKLQPLIPPLPPPLPSSFEVVSKCSILIDAYTIGIGCKRVVLEKCRQSLNRSFSLNYIHVLLPIPRLLHQKYHSGECTKTKSTFVTTSNFFFLPRHFYYYRHDKQGLVQVNSYYIALHSYYFCTLPNWNFKIKLAIFTMIQLWLPSYE